jgi:hypothetical protein
VKTEPIFTKARVPCRLVAIKIMAWGDSDKTKV